MARDALSQKVIGCAIEVHKQLGLGLIESSYERCLMHELAQAGISVMSQVSLLVIYKSVKLDAGYCLGILIPGKLIVELKAVDKFAPIHTDQMISYLKLPDIKTGLLINFNVLKLIDGVKWVVL
jgi:GxxExxY protein